MTIRWGIDKFLKSKDYCFGEVANLLKESQIIELYEMLGFDYKIAILCLRGLQ